MDVLVAFLSLVHACAVDVLVAFLSLVHAVNKSTTDYVVQMSPVLIIIILEINFSTPYSYRRLIIPMGNSIYYLH